MRARYTNILNFIRFIFKITIVNDMLNFLIKSTYKDFKIFR